MAAKLDGNEIWEALFSITKGDVPDGMTEAVCEQLASWLRGVAVASPSGQAGEAYQARVGDWLLACFGEAISRDKTERNHRFLEEALETVQAGGCTASEAHQLVDYVYGRPVGEIAQEIGGVMNTLAALCIAHGIDMNGAAETELARVWTKVEQIRAKQAAKPKHSPLPGPATPPADDDVERCFVCIVPFKEGDQVYSDISGGALHAACCGPERESYVGKDGEPLKDGEPIPEPYTWAPWPAPAPGQEGAEYRAIKQVAEWAEAIAAQAGVGSLETAGQIVSFLATRPELVPSLMDGTLDPITTSMLDHHAGSLSWHGKDGKVYEPDPSKVRALPPPPPAGEA